MIYTWRVRFIYESKEGVLDRQNVVDDLIKTQVFDILTAVYLAIKHYQTERMRMVYIEYLYSGKDKDCVAKQQQSQKKEERKAHPVGVPEMPIEKAVGVVRDDR